MNSLLLQSANTIEKYSSYLPTPVDGKVIIPKQTKRNRRAIRCHRLLTGFTSRHDIHSGKHQANIQQRFPGIAGLLAFDLPVGFSRQE